MGKKEIRTSIIALKSSTEKINSNYNFIYYYYYLLFIYLLFAHILKLQIFWSTSSMFSRNEETIHLAKVLLSGFGWPPLNVFVFYIIFLLSLFILFIFFMYDYVEGGTCWLINWNCDRYQFNNCDMKMWYRLLDRYFLYVCSKT